MNDEFIIGAQDVLEECKDNGLKIAIVTSSGRT